MGLVVATTVGLVIWIVMWALGIKALDAFMITVLLVLLGATMRIIAPVPAGQSRQLTATAWTQGPLRDISALR